MLEYVVICLLAAIFVAKMRNPIFSILAYLTIYAIVFVVIPYFIYYVAESTHFTYAWFIILVPFAIYLNLQSWRKII